MKKVLFILQFICLTGFSQSIITGTVSDQGTLEPMPYANIYLASTSMGTSSGVEGTFRFRVDRKGKYELVASFLGYTTFRIPIIIKADSTFLFQIRLTQKSSELPGVVVRADTSTRKKDYAAFKRLFIGESNNASSCVIKNPKDIYVYSGKSENVLLAYAKAPIIVENQALGYIVHFDLEKFEFNTLTEAIIIAGIPRFEALPAENEHKDERWNNARYKTYAGSLRHLMYSIINNRLKEEGWKVFIEYQWPQKSDAYINSKIRFHHNLHNSDSVNYYKKMRTRPPRSLDFYGKDLVSEKDNHVLIFKGTLQVEFIKALDGGTQ